ncbi:MAG: hypothetical protein FWE34_06270 [Defluviitaleaceae bacterium]|nr:hypothetical protein [Defluviitaleaceae bacterium]
MKKMKRIMAATLAMTVLFATTVFAQTPREIVGQAYANSTDATTMSVSGNIAGVVNLMGMELLRLNMDFVMDMDFDLETGAMMMYMRMPMQISVADPITGEAFDENVEVAVFMDGTTVFVYESTIGWFTDPSMDMSDMDDMLGMMDIEALTAWSLEINELIMDEITIQFADDQVDGYYVIEQIMDWDDMVNMLDLFMTPEFFDGMMAFIPEADMVLIQEDLDMAMLELDGMMDEMLAILEDLDINFEAVYRSYIDQETLTFSRYLMEMNMDFALDLDLGILGNMDISGSFTMDLDVDYNPTIVWPVIDEVVNLDDLFVDIMPLPAELEEAVVAIAEIGSLEFGADNLEVRETLPVAGDFAVGIINLLVADIANFNVFIVNHGTDIVHATLASVPSLPLFDVYLEPGEGFVLQIPMGTFADIATLVIQSSGAPLDVETGFRLTELPLGQ